MPDQFAGEVFGIEPRTDTQLNSKYIHNNVWPPPQIVKCSNTTIRIPNLSNEHKSIRKGEHFCQIRSLSTTTPSQLDSSMSQSSNDSKHILKDNKHAYLEISIDPHNITPTDYKYRLEVFLKAMVLFSTPSLMAIMVEMVT